MAADMLEAALSYAARGWAVFPLASRGKTPVIKGGFTNATTDAESIRAGWGRNPSYNVGIATGTMSGGLVVIDIDVHPERGEDGSEYLWEWERDHGELPETVSAITGSGGRHLFYRATENVGSSTNADAGIDIRADGGYIVAPPSIHPTGGAYAWENHPDEFEVAEADANVMAFIRSVQKRSEGARREAFKVPETIGAGQRNDTLFKLASSMQSKGDDTALIYAYVETVNKMKCRPPLPSSEVERIVESALRYEKGSAKPQGSASLMLKASGAPQQTIENCIRVLNADPALAGRVVYNEMAYTRMLRLPVPWDDGEGERPITDADYCALAAYMEREYGLMNKNKAIDAVMTVATANKVNPVTEWLDGLEWDGVPRVDTLLSVYLGCETNDYNAAVMRTFMAGAVARAYEPGAKFDYMPVLHGAQGIGKSMFLRRLGMRSDWYCDNFNTVEGDAAAEKLRGMWIVELAELLATKRQRDVESIKAFITSTVDTIRPKYARETEQRPRCCVFAGTTNSATFLTDATGNRRFLPVECGVRERMASLFDADAPAYFEQAWAEAVHMWRTGEWGLVLDERLAAYALESQTKYTEEDVRIGMVQQYLNGCTADARVCAMEVIENALGIRDGNPPRKLVNDVHAIMRNCAPGWVPHPKGKASTAYGVQRCYVRSEFAEREKQ